MSTTLGHNISGHTLCNKICLKQYYMLFKYVKVEYIFSNPSLPLFLKCDIQSLGLPPLIQLPSWSGEETYLQFRRKEEESLCVYLEFKLCSTFLTYQYHNQYSLSLIFLKQPQYLRRPDRALILRQIFLAAGTSFNFSELSFHLRKHDLDSLARWFLTPVPGCCSPRPCPPNPLHDHNKQETPTLHPSSSTL